MEKSNCFAWKAKIGIFWKNFEYSDSKGASKMTKKIQNTLFLAFEVIVKSCYTHICYCAFLHIFRPLYFSAAMWRLMLIFVFLFQMESWIIKSQYKIMQKKVFFFSFHQKYIVKVFIAIKRLHQLTQLLAINKRTVYGAW